MPNPAVARVYGVNSGVTIASVTPNGPAEKAGLKTGDTIVSVNGKTVKTGDELVAEISALKPGTDAKLGYVRNGKDIDDGRDHCRSLQAVCRRLGDQEEGGEEGQAAGEQVRHHRPGHYPGHGRPLPTSRTPKASIVQDVKPDGFGDNCGLSRGDVILEINKQPVNNEDDFHRIESQAKSGQDVVFLVRPRGTRDNTTIFEGGTAVIIGVVF